VSDYFDRIERQLVARVTAPRRSRAVRLASGRLVPAAAVVVAVAVVAVFFAVGAPRRTRLSPGGGTVLTYVARSTEPGVPLPTAVRATVARLRTRLAAVAPGVTVGRDGDRVTLGGVTAATRSAVQAVARTGQLAFFDWEANALTPTGPTVASQLVRQAPTALTISQGDEDGPGAGGGGMSLYHAVKLASRQPSVPADGSIHLSRPGALLYLFGAPGSSACAAVATRDGTGAVPGRHCLLAGPETSAGALRGELPRGVSMSDGEQLIVHPGTVVLQAAGASAGRSLAPSRPTARFYVLRDNPSLTGRAITHPERSTDQSGDQDVAFDFTAAGDKQFQKVTAAIAHRGAVDSPPAAGDQEDQHFAIALDQQLLSVPSIDFKVYPDGITGGGAADITGGFTRHTAHELAAILRTGPLPVSLIPLRP
jgi:SecD/SecF fusion protein